ncbi:lactonase family protein [Pseudomonas sp. nanlin1]|uniref:lactonase family protein n=1 Tax=Pseudomonas sp. nanlin1 TaxID=3040605 RepID=UPI00388EFB83
MKRIILPLLFAGAFGALNAHAAAPQYELLVGTYTQANSQGLYRYRFDAQSGLIEHKTLQVVKSDNPSWLTLSPDQTRLFVVNENGPGQKDVVGKVSSFALDPKTHAISPINQVQTQGDEPTHSSLSHDGRFLFIANYGVSPNPGGSLAVIAVDPQGRLASQVTQQMRYTPSKVNPERQAGGHVHSVVVAPAGDRVFATDLGADKVFAYRYDAAASAAPLTAADPAQVDLPAGSGPRHLLFSADAKRAYLSMEMSAQVAVFDYQDGTLVRRQLVDLTDRQAAEQKAAGALHLSPDGRFLYVSNRGKANELVVFAVNAGNGQLTFVQRRSVEGDHPREFTFDPSGQFVLVANQKSNQIVVIKRDPRTGVLGETVQKFPMDSPSDVKFLQPNG